jgi:hypothetical protein
MSSDFDEPMIAPQEESAPEKAFRDSDRESAEETWKGMKLYNFSWLRKTAAYSLGLKYWQLTPNDINSVRNPRYEELTFARQELLEYEVRKDEEKDQKELDARKAKVDSLKDEPETVEVYNEILMDTAIVLYLCTQPDSICHRVRRNPREFEKKVDKWAETNEILVGGGVFGNNEAINLFMTIVNEVNQSDFVPDLDNEQKKAVEEKN